MPHKELHQVQLLPEVIGRGGEPCLDGAKEGFEGVGVINWLRFHAGFYRGTKIVRVCAKALLKLIEAAILRVIIMLVGDTDVVKDAVFLEVAVLLLVR